MVAFHILVDIIVNKSRTCFCILTKLFKKHLRLMKEKIKQVDLKKLEEQKFLLNFYSKNSTQTVEIDEAICYRIYRQIKTQLKLQ